METLLKVLSAVGRPVYQVVLLGVATVINAYLIKKVKQRCENILKPIYEWEKQRQRSSCKSEQAGVA